MATDGERIASVARARLPLENARLSDEYFYASVPLCAIDAVFSIGVRYEGVRNVVARYCERTGSPRLRDRDVLPSPALQEPASAFVARLDALGPERAADELFGNRQRTSSTNGILKADAVRHFAAVLRDRKVERLQDVPSAMSDDQLEAAIRAIPGQSSGLSLAYFWMLAGSDEHVKPDRMVLRFLSCALDRDVKLSEAPLLLANATTILRGEYPQITPRLLDHLIWAYQRNEPTKTDPTPAILDLLPTLEADGFEACAWRNGYPEYHPALLALTGLVNGVDPYAKLPEDPPDVEPVRVFRDKAAAAQATAAQALRYLAQLLRGERFCDGYIAGEFAQGRLLAVLHRLRELSAPPHP